MEQRKYSVAEIDALRQVWRNRLIWGVYDHNRIDNKSQFGFQYKPVDLEHMIEDKVRTSMLAGHTAEDFITSEQETK